MEHGTFHAIMDALKQDMRGPRGRLILRAAFPEEGGPVEPREEPRVRETHISVVFLLGNRVFKFKKPVNYGFIAQGKLPERLQNCENEIRLNRRLAPDVYLGILGVQRDGPGYKLGPVSDEDLEYCVVMRRLDDAHSLASRLRAGRLDNRHMERTAQTIADFHHACPRGPKIAALHDFEKNLSENLAVLRVAGGVPPELPAGIEACVRKSRAALRRRELRGEIIDGHGDLRPEHVYFHEDHVRIIDCVEFNPRIRAGDPFEDLAFLSMSLRVAGRNDLANALVAAYVSRTADAPGLSLLPLFEIYRASVRAKIDHLMLRSGAPRHEDYYQERVHKYLRFIQSVLHRRASAGNKIHVVMGLPASGKSTYARTIAAKYSLPVLSTDIIRKSLLGLTPETRAGKEAFARAYSPEFSGRVYRALIARARLVLKAGYDVVLDGVFAENSRRRRLLRLARELGVEIEFHLVSAGEETIRERLIRRKQKAGISDLDDPEIWRRIRDSFEEPDEFIAPRTRVILQAAAK